MSSSGVSCRPWATASRHSPTLPRTPLRMSSSSARDRPSRYSGSSARIVETTISTSSSPRAWAWRMTASLQAATASARSGATSATSRTTCTPIALDMSFIGWSCLPTPKVRMQQLLAPRQLGRAPLQHDFTLGEHVGPVGVLQGHVHELLDDEHGGAGGVDVADDLEQQAHDLG